MRFVGEEHAGFHRAHPAREEAPLEGRVVNGHGRGSGRVPDLLVRHHVVMKVGVFERCSLRSSVVDDAGCLAGGSYPTVHCRGLEEAHDGLEDAVSENFVDEGGDERVRLVLGRKDAGRNGLREDSEVSLLGRRGQRGRSAVDWRGTGVVGEGSMEALVPDELSGNSGLKLVGRRLKGNAARGENRKGKTERGANR